MVRLLVAQPAKPQSHALWSGRWQLFWGHESRAPLQIPARQRDHHFLWTPTFSSLWAKTILRQESVANSGLFSALYNEAERKDRRNSTGKTSPCRVFPDKLCVASAPVLERSLE